MKSRQMRWKSDAGYRQLGLDVTSQSDFLDYRYFIYDSLLQAKKEIPKSAKTETAK